MPTVFDGNFTAADLNGAPVISQDFPDSNEVTSFVAPLMQVVASYSPLAFTASTSYLGATWYYAGDRGFRDRGAGVAEFSREYAKIPATRTVPGGSRAFTYPGFSAATGAASVSLTAATFTSTSTTLTATAHGLAAGDTVMIYISASGGIFGAASYFGSFLTNVRTVINANQFTIGPTAASGFSLNAGSVQKYTPARNPRTEATSTLIQYDYALPGVTSGVTSALDFNAYPEFRVVGASGETGVENVLTNNTAPTIAQYLTAISNGALLVAESSVSVWKGAILERKTIYVKAQ